MKKAFMSIFWLSTVSGWGQLERVEPPHWWVGFKDSSLQLLVKGEAISDMSPLISYPGVRIEKVHKAKSSNYLFIDLKIDSNAEPGWFDLILDAEGKKKIKYSYELKARKKEGEDYLGFDSSDVIYLITPDRFANGNPDNDIVQGLRETNIDREDNYGRHGGDIKGILNHLDYIEVMGFTAVWPTPLLTNDMSQSSYHGYAITDLYQIDPRFGTLEDYLNLSEKASERGMKLIMDQVANHCGLEHWWMKDLPFEDWVNYQKDFESGNELTMSNHRRMTNQDIYQSEIDGKEMNEGWFVEVMPDLNQRNPFMSKYLIQNSIWWIEEANLGGIRQDTYPYSDKNFISQWAGAIMNEYPNFNIVGEEWSYNPLLIGYWQRGANNKDGYESNLRSPMDFPMQQKIIEAVNEQESWDQGLNKIYEALANDFHYTTPKDLMVFGDNHDMDRIHTQTKNNVISTKMALIYLLSLPRIPQVYYGTEILMENSEKPGDHGLIRSDFPGGWEGDKVNAFTGEGLDENQKDMQEYLRTVLNYRKNSKAIHIGKTIHFGPKDGVYVLVRSHEDEMVIVVLNKNEEPYSLDLKRFRELGLEGVELKNVLTHETFLWKDQLELNSRGCILLSSKHE